MHHALRHLPGMLALLAIAASPGAARAAQSYDNCTGFIDAVPATITKQGVWCLRKDLGTNLTSGVAINIATNNVTIDCNDFKVGGLAAGNGSNANGIRAENRQNVTVRHCNVRGFRHGIVLIGGAGHLIEDNRLDNNLTMGIVVGGENTLVQRNRVYDTGGFPNDGFSTGIFARADVIDNVVDGVFATHANASSSGITMHGVGSVARENRVRGLFRAGSGIAYGIIAETGLIVMESNQVISDSAISGYGIFGFGGGGCRNNVVARFSNAIVECQDLGGNATLL